MPEPTMRNQTPGKTIGRLIFALLFVSAGMGHFVATGFFEKIMPPYVPYPRAMVLFSGFFEVALGVLLVIPKTSRFTAWGLIALLIAVFPANLHMALHAAEFSIPPLVLLVRLPMQGLLIYWAWLYTRK